MDRVPEVHLAGGVLQGKNIRLRLVTVQDAPFIFELRNNAARNQYLSPIGDLLSQVEWIEKYKERETRGDEHYFIIEDALGHARGTVRIYDKRGDSFTAGSWATLPDTPPIIALESFLLIYAFAFGDLGLQHCRFEVNQENQSVIEFNLRLGAQMTGQRGSIYQFSYSREDYEAARDRYARFLPPST